MKVFFTILGSLGVFLFGMKIMSESLQKTAGNKLRSFLASVTKTRFHGILTGLGVCSVLHSSSATTVMVVSFVNAGLFNLRQAFGVIMGANLGTTLTAWIVAILGFKFSIADFALPTVGIGVIMVFIPRERVQNIGMTIVGSGLLLMGMGMLKDAVPVPDINSPLFGFVQNYTYAKIGYPSVLIFFGFGVLLTILVQSSAAAMAITMTMAAMGWIGINESCAIVLGENVGTTITAILASLALGRNSKRAALLHTLFNVIGVMWMLVVFTGFMKLMQHFPFLVEEAPVNATAEQIVKIGQSNITKQTAFFHTSFNLLNISILVWFSPYLVTLVEKIIPKKVSEEQKEEGMQRLVYAKNVGGVGAQLAEFNLSQAEQGVYRLSNVAQEMFKGFIEIYSEQGDNYQEKLKELRDLEDRSDIMTGDLVNYLLNCSGGNLSEESERRATVLIRVTSELEEICDCTKRLINFADKAYSKKYVYSSMTREGLLATAFITLDTLKLGAEYLKKEDLDDEDLEYATRLRRSIKSSIKKLSKSIAQQSTEKQETLRAEMLHLQIIDYLDLTSRHQQSMVELLARNSRTLA